MCTGVEKKQTLQAQLCDVKLKAELMDDCKKMVKGANQNADAALLQVFNVEGKLSKDSKKRKAIETKIREAVGEFGQQLIRVSNLLVRPGLMDKVLRGVIALSETVLDDFLYRLGGELVNSFLFFLRRPDLENEVEFAVVLTYLSRAGATSVFW